jgi:hypothetical protein
MPETDGEGAHQTAQHLYEQLRGCAPNLRIGFATCPEDGCEVDALIEAVRRAARVSESGRIATAAELYQTVEIGDRRALVADPARGGAASPSSRSTARRFPIT